MLGEVLASSGGTVSIQDILSASWFVPFLLGVLFGMWLHHKVFSRRGN